MLAVGLLWSSASQAQVDIHGSTEALHDGIRSVGPATTQRTLQKRKRQPFKDWEDLVARVRRIGAVSAARYFDQGFTVIGQPYARSHPASSTAAQ